MRYLFTLFLLIGVFSDTFSQNQYMSITGNIQDTVVKAPLPYAVAMAIKFKDSTLVKYARTDAKGYFKLDQMPVDTYQVVLSHPTFGEQVYFIFGSSNNTTFDFGKITLPPKSLSLNEVIIYAFKDPIYYKGDTLIYTADSFKVKPNATVEDLLKKLPGMKVDANGKITAQGKEVDQVLVDGDEFFGGDATVATRNLNANAIESVQVFEKKNDAPSDKGDDETLKILNLKLKEDAKKGYFGKVSAGGDFSKFYEGEVLANKFSAKQKISVFGLGSNTPRSRFDWSDVYTYGLNDEKWQNNSDDEGTMFYTMNSSPTGIPQTLKTGFYYMDNLNKKTKLTTNYSYSSNELRANKETSSHYFLSDTSYIINEKSNSFQRNEAHNISLTLSAKPDSLTELEITPRFKYILNNKNSIETNEFLTDDNVLNRSTDIRTSNKGRSNDFSSLVKVKRKFRKRDRLLAFTYNFQMIKGESDGFLKSFEKQYDVSALPGTNVDQQKINDNKNRTDNVSVVFTEPITKKIKLEFAYDYYYSSGLQNKKTLDFVNGEYSTENALLTNNFKNIKNTQRLGTKFIYEVKKQRFSIGARARQVSATSTELISGTKTSQIVNNLLPNLSYRYKFSDNSSLNFQYNAYSNQPSLNQLQPIPDNTNPNRVTLGNLNLLPTFEQKMELHYNVHKAISGKYIWSGLTFSFIDNDFSNAISYDSIGRTITQPVNVNGNYNSHFYLSGQIPILSSQISLSPNLGGDYKNRSSYINNQKNNTKESSINLGLDVEFDFDAVVFSLGGNYDYSNPVSSLNIASNEPYSSQSYSASLELTLPKKFMIKTFANYTMNDQRAQGYNINYLLWNASVNKIFLKKENLIISVSATDMLNQNISTSRYVQDNIITDTKTDIISRYFLLKAVFKFNSNKQKKDDSDF